MYNLNRCACTSVVKTSKYYKGRLAEEWAEFKSEPSLDEWADCMLLLSLLIYSITKLAVVIPPAALSIKKGRDRLEKHGCVRSEHNSCAGGGH